MGCMPIFPVNVVKRLSIFSLPFLNTLVLNGQATSIIMHDFSPFLNTLVSNGQATSIIMHDFSPLFRSTISGLLCPMWWSAFGSQNSTTVCSSQNHAPGRVRGHTSLLSFQNRTSRWDPSGQPGRPYRVSMTCTDSVQVQCILLLGGSLFLLFLDTFCMSGKKI